MKMILKNKLRKSVLNICFPLTIISPMVFIMSCSKNDSSFNKYEQDGINYLQQGKIKVVIETSDTKIKLNNLKEYKIKYEMNVEKPENDSKEEQEYENILNALSNNDFELVSHFIPKLNDDINSSLLFQVNENDNNLVELPIQKIFLNNDLITNNNVENLTSIEIKEDIKNNLENIFSFNVNLQNKINTIVNEKYKNDFLQINENITIEQIQEWCTNQKIQEKLIKELKNWFFSKPFIFFNYIYDNVQLEIKDWNIGSTKYITFKLLISTSDISTHSDTVYDIGNIKIWLKK